MNLCYDCGTALHCKRHGCKPKISQVIPTPQPSLEKRVEGVLPRLEALSERMRTWLPATSWVANELDTVVKDLKGE